MIIVMKTEGNGKRSAYKNMSSDLCCSLNFGFRSCGANQRGPNFRHRYAYATHSGESLNDDEE